MKIPDYQTLAMIAGETERLFDKIGKHYEDEEEAPDKVAEFVIACRDAAIADAEAQPSEYELKYSSLSPKALKAAKNRARNKRKAQKKSRKRNRV